MSWVTNDAIKGRKFASRPRHALEKQKEVKSKDICKALYVNTQM